MHIFYIKQYAERQECLGTYVDLSMIYTHQYSIIMEERYVKHPL